MNVIVGLGNPGKDYENTRHNIGFMIVDYLAKQQGVTTWQQKFQSLVATTTISGQKILLVKPQTFMNLSGNPLRKIKDFYKLSPSNFLILYADLDLEPFSVRYRAKGSSGGHNGIKSIIENLGTTEFPRIKVGIGKPRISDNKLAITQHVLKRFSQNELELLQSSITEATEKTEKWIGELSSV